MAEKYFSEAIREAIQEEMRREEFDNMERRFKDLIEKFKCRRVRVDASGIGMQIAEALRKRFGRSKVEEVAFSNPEKVDLMHSLKKVMEQGRLHLPAYDEAWSKSLMNDLRAIRRLITAGMNVTYDAPHDDRGHADSAWALALALTAAEQKAAKHGPRRAEAGGPIESLNGF